MKKYIKGRAISTAWCVNLIEFFFCMNINILSGNRVINILKIKKANKWMYILRV